MGLVFEALWENRGRCWAGKVVVGHLFEKFAFQSTLVSGVYTKVRGDGGIGCLWA